MIDEEYLDLNIIELISACKNLKVLGVPLEWLNEELSLKKLYNLLKEQSEWKSHRLIVKCLRKVSTIINRASTKELWRSNEHYGNGLSQRRNRPLYPTLLLERLFEIHFNKPVD
ncbi:unnamed protein product [Ceratitis capitata]|uniref:(Mediterranean fruit fly) hypothetical protein n=1 Tax=Ceratitis capitata TaxID=7213 RepID=A0A811VBS7_CERCA|nr:unnamed protein product [Ceratitis capitata]